MEINLTRPFTKEDVRALLASVDDSQNWQLRVRKEGSAFLSADVGANKLDGILFRLETWVVGNGYVGPKAAADDGFVQRIYDVLKKNYPVPKSSYIDVF
jgi:hypothetical protein